MIKHFDMLIEKSTEKIDFNHANMSKKRIRIRTFQAVEFSYFLQYICQSYIDKFVFSKTAEKSTTD